MIDIAPAEATGTLAQALALTDRLLEDAPARAAEQARAILDAVPGHPHAILLLARAHRRDGRAADARALLEPLAAAQPRSAATRDELGHAALALGDENGALAAWREAVALAPDRASAWRGLAELYAARDEEELAADASAHALRAAARDPELLAAATALCQHRIAVAEQLLRARLARTPDDPPALRMLAEVAARLGRYPDATRLLEHALAVDPAFDAARAMLAQLLQRQNDGAGALPHVDRLLARDPRHFGWRILRAAVLARLGRYDEAIALYDTLLAERPDQPKTWMSLGHALKTVGRQADAVAAYRAAIARAPTLGEAWWSLANLKTVRFDDADLAAMRAAADTPGLADEDRFHLDFALAKALEDTGDDAQAFARYAAGNAVRRAALRYDADATTEQVRRTAALADAAFFAARHDGGCPAPDPIFVLGLPRAGSTLIEQILASHPLVEGTAELPDIGAIAQRLGGSARPGQPSRYPEALADLGPADRTALGEEYLARTRPQRQTTRPYFVDKMPGNWLHVALIRLILPNATIVDARRHPLACGWSVFKQHFARGQAFSYDLADIGRYCREYIALMTQFDTALPGAVHRIIYEDMVADTETQVRRLLAHANLPFDARCLRYWENDRPVRTASSEQVRKPIFQDGLDQWKRFAPWLDPLEAALGPALTDWRG